MIAAAARAPIALRAGQFGLDDFSIFRRFWEVPRSQGRGYGGGQSDVGFLPPGPMMMVGTFKTVLETRMRALGDLEIGGRRKIV